MNHDLKRVEDLFAGALEKPADERAAFLESACASNAALRERVEVLLRAHAASGKQKPTSMGRFALWVAVAGVILPLCLLLSAIVLSKWMRIPDPFVNLCAFLGVGLELIAVACGFTGRASGSGKAGMIVGGIALVVWLALGFQTIVPGDRGHAQLVVSWEDRNLRVELLREEVEQRPPVTKRAAPPPGEKIEEPPKKYKKTHVQAGQAMSLPPGWYLLRATLEGEEFYNEPIWLEQSKRKEMAIPESADLHVELTPPEWQLEVDGEKWTRRQVKDRMIFSRQLKIGRHILKYFDGQGVLKNQYEMVLKPPGSYFRYSGTPVPQ